MRQFIRLGCVLVLQLLLYWVRVRHNINYYPGAFMVGLTGIAVPIAGYTWALYDVPLGVAVPRIIKTTFTAFIACMLTFGVTFVGFLIWPTNLHPD